MNRYESDMWAKASMEQFEQKAKKELSENGSPLLKALKLVLKECHVSNGARTELIKNLEIEEERIKRLLENWSYR